MGAKTNANGIRYGVNKNWISRWTAPDYATTAKWIVEDEKVRNLFIKTFTTAQIVRIEIERTAKAISIFVYCGQPGIIDGKTDEEKKAFLVSINKIVGRKMIVNQNIISYDNPAWSARVIAREIADDIENRTPFRMAMKKAVKKVMMAKAKGIKTKVGGRLGGAEIARSEGYAEGNVPLSTLRADIDYALEEAHTTMGIIGCKVWINRGEMFGSGLNNQIPVTKPEIIERRPRGNFDRNSHDKKPASTFKKPFTPNKDSISTRNTVREGE